MTNFMVTYHADSIESLVKFYAGIMASGAADLTRQEKGCVRYEYFLPVEDILKMSQNGKASDKADPGQENSQPATSGGPVSMLLWEQWESREDQAAHCQAPHFKIFGQLKEQFGITADFLVQDIAE